MAICPTCHQTCDSADGSCPRCAQRRNGSSQAPDATTGELLTLLELEESRDVPVASPLADGSDTGESRNGLHVDIKPRLEYPAVPAGSDPVVHLMVDITPDGPPLLSRNAPAVAHVILVLDISASMNHPDKYPVLTEALSGMLYELASPRSAPVLLSVVLFAYGAEVLFRDIPASQIDPRDVLARVDRSSLRFGRYTDVVGGLARAGRIAHDQLKVERAMPTRIYLLTDGKPQDVAGARAVMDKIRKLPVDIDGLAFGNDADVVRLQELVSGGRGGTVKHVRTETLSEAFDRIGQVAQRIVTNRSIFDLDLAPGVAGGAAWRYRPARHRFAGQPFENGKFRADLGTLESGRTYSLVFEIRVPETKADRTDIGTITLRLPAAGGARLFTASVSIPRTRDAALPEPNSEVVAAREVVAALSDDDPQTQLRALRIRRKLYVSERRDPHVIAVIDKAIAALEEEGSLAALSASEWATLRSHTCTAGGAQPPSTSRRVAVA